jgi:plastocyanin
MIWLSRICSDGRCRPLRFLTVSAQIFLGFALSLSAATVTGRVTLRDSRKGAVRTKADFSGVVVWLEGAQGNSMRFASGAKAASAHVQMLQKGKTFVPHVLAVTVGTTVDFPNLDPIFHNAFSVYDGQLFDIGLYAPGSSRGIRFTRPGFVRVFCNIHSTMSAVIAVMDTPLFAVSGPDGHFEIDRVPNGVYEMRIFHERSTESALEAARRRVNVDSAQVELPETEISQAGYLAIPHKNKYGRDYLPAPDDAGIYPATRK